MPVGRVVGVFGLKGAVKVDPLTDFPQRFAPGGVLHLNGKAKAILDCHWHQGQVRLTLEGVATPEAAESLRGSFLTIPIAERAPLLQDEFFVRDLIGCEVFEEGHGTIGRVDRWERGAGCDYLVVSDCMIPLRKEFVQAVDLESRRITVTLIDGMRPGETPDEVPQ